MPRPQTTPRKRNRFIGAVTSGIPVKDAAKKENIPLSTAYDLRALYQKTGAVDAAHRPGGEPKLSDRDKRALVIAAKRAPFASTRSLIAATGLEASRSTASRALKDAGA